MIKMNLFQWGIVAEGVISSLVIAQMVVDMAAFAMSPEMVWSGDVLYAVVMGCLFIAGAAVISFGTLSWIFVGVDEW